MPWKIIQRGNKYLVVKKDNESQVVGTHSSRTQAIAHMRALYASEADN